MSGYTDFRLHQAYNKLLFQWQDKIQNLEKCYTNSKIPYNSPSRIKLQSKMENLKSYFYSIRYYSSFESEDFKNKIKELLQEMRNLEKDIYSLLNVQNVRSRLKIV